jgi:hypothetical protein
VACLRADQGLEKRHWRGKQPANLAVEAAEESLSILPDYTPTVRPPPTALLTILARHAEPNVCLLSRCHRRVYGVRCALAERRGLRGGGWRL